MSAAPRPIRPDARVPGLVPETGAAGSIPSQQLFYRRLVRVSVRHDYYADTGHVCHDFSTRPTRYTAWLLDRLGLLFREEDDGFSVLYNGVRSGTLLWYLRSKAESSRSGRPWGRLCFTLSPRNPWFVNFTDLPPDTNPACWNLYLTNHRPPVAANGPALLSRGARVSADDRMRVTGPLLVESAGRGVTGVRVLSVAGTEVLRARRSAPPGAGTPASGGVWPPSAATDRSERLYLDLGGLPEGKYTVEPVMDDGRAGEASELLYTAADPVPLGFVELLLADPTGEGGVYPVRGLGTAEQEIACAPYEVAFAARRTWWSYYVVGGPPRGELRIRQRRAPDEPRTAFLGPCPVMLAGGRTAWRFVSRCPIALARRPTLHLQLVWRREGGRRVDVLMDRLPLADGRGLVQEETAGQGVQALLCPCDENGPRHRCRRLLQWLAGDGPPGSPPRIFSDIYVHV
jgi:hypothetical protein